MSKTDAYFAAKREFAAIKARSVSWGNMLRDLGEALLTSPERVEMKHSAEGVPLEVALTGLSVPFDARQYPTPEQIIGLP